MSADSESAEVSGVQTKESDTDEIKELAEAKRVIWFIRHIARDAYLDNDLSALERIMGLIDKYGATRGLVEGE